MNLSDRYSKEGLAEVNFETLITISGIRVNLVENGKI